MTLNYIWLGFFLIALVVGLTKLIFLGDTTVFTTMVQATFDSAKTGFEISLGLTGVLTLWLGLMRSGRRAGRSTSWRPWCARSFAASFPRSRPITRRSGRSS
jgi:spore maturation protein SpmA